MKYMGRFGWAVGVFFVACVIFVSFVATGLFTTTPDVPQVRAKWLVAHTPENQRLIEHARQFNAAILERTGGKVSFELVLPPEKQRDGNDFDWATDSVVKGDFQVSQISVGSLSRLDTGFQILELPYLFNNHAHAAEVFDGEVGQELRDRFVAQSKTVRPLAFTYSGGMRVMVSNRKIEKIGDLVGMKARLQNGLVPKAPGQTNVRLSTYRSLEIDAKPIAFGPGVHSELDLFRKGYVEFSEDHYSHYTRLYKKYGLVPGKMGHVLETNHSLFLTAIVVNEAFYQSLSEDFRQILREEAQKLALAERADSIDIDRAAKEWLEASGFDVAIPSAEFQTEMKRKTEAVYQLHRPRLGEELIERIRRIGKSRFAER